MNQRDDPSRPASEPDAEHARPAAASDEARDFEFQDAEMGDAASAHVHIEPRPLHAPHQILDQIEDERRVLRTGKLRGLTMWAAIFTLAWPVVVESFFNSLVGIVDTILAADISAAATDAIGVASYFQWFIGLLTIALGVGATALVSRSIGKNRPAYAGAVAAQVLLIAVAAGAVMGVGIFALAPQLTSWLELEPGSPARGHAITYLRVLAIGVPFVTVLFSSIACSRGAGDSVSPLWIMGGINAVNIAVSVALVSPMFDLGVMGIALGTLVAWIIGACAGVGLLLRGTHGLQLRPHRLKPHWVTIKRLVRVGAPNFVETLGMWTGNFITILFIGWAGIEGLYGAHVIAIRIESVSFMPGFGMAIAAATLTGQYLGAKRPDLAARAIRRCTTVGAALMGALGLVYLAFPVGITRLFSDQPIHLEIVPKLVMTFGFIQIPFAIAIVVRGALRGAGDTTVVMILTWISAWGIRLPLAWLGSGVDFRLPFTDAVITNPRPLQDMLGLDIGPLWGLWIGMCLELCIRFMLFGIRFLQGGWTKVRV